MAGKPRVPTELPGAESRSIGPRRWLNLRLLVWLLIGLNLLLVLEILTSPRGLHGYFRNRAELAEMERKLEKLTSQNRERFEAVQKLRDDPRTLEQVIRDQLGWVRADETVIEFRPAPRTANER